MLRLIILPFGTLFLRLLDKYLYKELLGTFLAVLIVLLLISFGTEISHLLAAAAEGKFPPGILAEMLMLKMPSALEVILPLVALLGVMIAVGRLYQDLEMVVMNSCGISPAYFQTRVFIFLVPVVLFTAWISLFVTPWAYNYEKQLIEDSKSLSPLGALVAGRFNELPSGEGTLYAGKISADGDMTDVWIRLKSAERDVILAAPSGRFEWIDARLALVLFNGFSYEGLAGGDQLTVREYERFEGYLPQTQAQLLQQQRRGRDSITLYHSANLYDQAQLHWRLVVPFSVLALGLLGLKLSKTGPREGRFGKIFLALLIFVVYNNMLLSAKSSMQVGGLPMTAGLLPVPLILILYALYQGRVVPVWLSFSTLIALIQRPFQSKKESKGPA